MPTIWFMISEKSITRCAFLHYGACMHHKSQQSIPKNCAPEFPILSALKLPLGGLMVFIDITTYMFTEDRNFKKCLKDNYAITCYLFTDKTLNMILIVLMEFAYIRHSWNLKQIWWIPSNLSRRKQIMNLTVS